MAKDKKAKQFRTSIGGQALIEGVMMRGPKKQAIVVRTKEGFVTKCDDLKLPKDKYPILGFPLIRGVVNFVSMLSVGMKSLTFSAEQFMDEEEEGGEEPSKLEKWINEKFGAEKAEKALIAFSVVIGVALSVGLFILLPTVLAGFLSGVVENGIVRSLVEGVMRIAIFVAYLWLAMRLNDIKRVWAYHGAEHKAIYCYEKGLELTVANTREQSRLHPRCGTSFIFIVLMISILVFSFLSWSNVWLRIGMRLLLLPVVVAISYEIIKLAGKYDNILTRIISAPGKAMQRLTTREPDDDMIETAVEALKMVIPEKEEEAEW